MCEIKARVLYKGLGRFESKKKKDEATGLPVVYHSASFFGAMGTPADFQADLDLSNGGKAIYDRLQKMQPSMVDVTLDLTFYDRQARFKVLAIEPVK